MTHVVLESCIRCRYTDCVDVCPVDCFREGPNMLVIDPDECIDCAVCIPECPVEAIVAEEDVPPGMEAYIGLNAELAKQWPAITRKKEPLPDADEGGGLRKRRSSARKRGKRNNPKATICAGVIPCCIAEMKLHIMSERDSPGRSNAVRHP